MRLQPYRPPKAITQQIWGPQMVVADVTKLYRPARNLEALYETCALVMIWRDAWDLDDGAMMWEMVSPYPAHSHIWTYKYLTTECDRIPWMTVLLETGLSELQAEELFKNLLAEMNKRRAGLEA